ncbi:sigma-70 family RNA polymerase sigma factor [Brevibacillus gelatini]|uniref:Sigma-70 family RNA polymerase sigma factor n=2 Tax=Brevibacillus gelatini TaxID=1655277 RepID=A0A3M8AYZ3_9BACL|nr:sigma-70 family RNA polymerase sigma factor [Brevibacillus gelatini]
MKESMEQVYRKYKGLMFSLAYQMTGSVAEAEDIVQETFVALADANINDILHVKSYLCKAVTNRCLDTLKSARWKREQYVGEWLPEPLFDDRGAHDPLHAVIAEESVSYSLLVLLDTLSPAERAVYVLRTALDLEYRAIAEMLDKTEASCRKLYSRAQQRLKASGLPQNTVPARSRKLIEQLIQAISRADATALVQLLTEDAVLISDGGGKARAALRPIFSGKRVAAFWLGVWPKWADHSAIEIRSINGEDGIAVYSQGELKVTIQLRLSQEKDRIERMYMIVNPEKLAHLQK